MLEQAARYRKQWGAIVLGPVGTAAEAVALIEQDSLDCAILDYKLVDGSSRRVADALVERNVPFVFASGYDSSVIDSQYPNAPFLEKVFDLAELLAAISAVGRRVSLVRSKTLDPRRGGIE